MTEPLESSIQDVKQNLSRLLDIPINALRLEIDGDELIDEDTLDLVGCVEDGNMEIKMTILLPLVEQEKHDKPKNDKKKEKMENSEEQEESFYDFLANQPLNRRPKLIYEPEPKLIEKDDKKSAMNRYKKKNQYHVVDCPLLDGSVKQVKVEIDHMFGQKPLLGIFRQKLTKKEYHHAASQTTKAVTVNPKDAKTLISRHIQTRPEIDKEEQTSSEKCTQVARHEKGGGGQAV